jgi:alkylation response protein AidB-like acyl-CoA dehydrogenase
VIAVTSSTTDGLIDWDAYVPREETQALADAARDHFATLFTTDDIRRVLEGDPRPDVWSTLVEHGYVLVGVPEELDGLGTLVDLVALLEEAGRALLPAPLLTHAMAAQTLLAIGALDGASANSSLAFGIAQEGGWHVFDGTQADAVISVNRSGDGAMVRVASLTGAPREVLAGVDPSRPFVRLTAGDVIVEHVSARHPDILLAGARTCVAADLVGVAARALDAGVGHALEREQFGRAIGSFQSVKHQLADAYVLLERARSLVLGSAVALSADRTGTDGARLSMLAKAAAGEAAARTTALLTQLLGAMGLTFESDGPLAVRRAQHTIPLLGTSGELFAQVGADTAKGR